MKSLRQKLEAMREGKLTASANLAEKLNLVEELNPKIKALSYVAKETVTKKAGIIDTIPKPDQGRLHGLIFSAKDNYQIAGLPASEGSAQTAIQSAKITDPVIESILGEGALLIGKGNMPEYGKSNFCENDIFGRTVNPWNPEYTSGGSTGGDAAAVAAKMTDFGIGGDSGGSLRVPASFCGLYSILPTRRLIKRSSSPFITNSFFKTMGSSGPLTRSLEDLELLFDLMTRESVLRPSPLSPRGQSKKTFMVLKEIGGVGCNPEIEKGLQTAAQRFKNIGWEEVSYPNNLFQESIPVFFTLGGQAGTLQEDLVRASKKITIDPSKESATIKKLRSDISTLLPPLSVESLLTHLYAWEDLKRQAEELFQSVDIVLSPVAAVSCLKNGATEGEVNGQKLPLHHLFHFARVANVLDMVAVSFPIGFNDQGLPIGLQIMTKSGHDRFALRTLSSIGFVEPLER